MLCTFLTLLAEQERDDAIEWYANQRLSRARNWLDEFDRLLDRLENNPFQYAGTSTVCQESEAEHLSIHIFYAVDELNLVVEIIGVQHTSRDPAIIRRRINF